MLKSPLAMRVRTESLEWIAQESGLLPGPEGPHIKNVFKSVTLSCKSIVITPTWKCLVNPKIVSIHTDPLARVTHCTGLWKQAETNVLSCIHLFIKTLTRCLPNSNPVPTVLVGTRIYDGWLPPGQFTGQLEGWTCVPLAWVFLFPLELVTVESLDSCWQSPVISSCPWEWTSWVAFCMLEGFQPFCYCSENGVLMFIGGLESLL